MKDYKHVTAMADYALRIREQLASVNEHSFNNFRLRVGINIGPVTSIKFWIARVCRNLQTLAPAFLVASPTLPSTTRRVGGKSQSVGRQLASSALNSLSLRKQTPQNFVTAYFKLNLN